MHLQDSSAVQFKRVKYFPPSCLTDIQGRHTRSEMSGAFGLEIFIVGKYVV
uniref:Uncharacterized protein n=1 Tax=Anguilla anguilla TaxID=7936 RepID=A0A0E9VD63_ANGAN